MMTGDVWGVISVFWVISVARVGVAASKRGIVIELGDGNFTQQIAEYEVALVKFYVPWYVLHARIYTLLTIV